MNQDFMDKVQAFSGVEQLGRTQSNEIVPGNYAPPAPLQQVKTNFTTAVHVQKPRSISLMASMVLQEASLAGAAFYYRWTVTKKNGEKQIIQGPSIDLAMCCVRNYQNCVINVEVEETPMHYIFKGTLIDLESGFTCPRLYRQRKSQAIGKKFDQDRQEDILFQIGQSKAIRNAIVHAMPSWLIDKAIDVAYKSELSSIRPENIAAARARCITFFAGHGIDVVRLEEKIGRPADQWTNADIVDMRAMATGIKEGKIGVDELFPPDEPKTGAEIVPEKMQAPPDQEQAEKERRLDPRWARDAWIHLKSTGLKAHAELFKETFANVPLDTRMEFEEKWKRCGGLGPFPFDAEGNWIQANVQIEPDATTATPSSDEAGDDQPGDFESWLELNYPKVSKQAVKDFLNYSAEKSDIPLHVYQDRMMRDPNYAIEVIDQANEQHAMKFQS